MWICTIRELSYNMIRDTIWLYAFCIAKRNFTLADLGKNWANKNFYDDEKDYYSKQDYEFQNLFDLQN